MCLKYKGTLLQRDLLQKKNAPGQYIWAEESKKDFLDLISTPEFNSLWDKNVEIDHSNPNLLVNHATETLIMAARKAKIKYSKGDRANDPPWFDKPCQDLKCEIKKLAKKVRKCTKDTKSRTELFAKRKGTEKAHKIE